MCAVLSCSLQFSQTPVPSNVGKFIPAFYIGLTDLVPWKPNLIFHLMDGMFWNSAAIEFLTDGLHVRIRVRVCVRARTHTYTHTHTGKSLAFPISRESHESSARDVFTFLITDWNFTFLCERIYIKRYLWYKAVKLRKSVTCVWLWCWQNALWEMFRLRYKMSCTWSLDWKKMTNHQVQSRKRGPV